MKSPLPLLVLLITLFVGLSGLGQEPARDSIPFESLKGQLPMPVDRFTNLKTYEQWLNRSKDRFTPGCGGDNKSLTIQSDSPITVKNVAAGKVISIFEVDGSQAIIVSQGKYYFIYSNLNTVFVKKEEVITVGQTIGKVLTNSYDGLYDLELLMGIMRDDRPESVDPYPWFAHSQYF